MDILQTPLKKKLFQIENTMDRQGLIINIEGLDGSGKTTQTAKIIEWLRATQPNRQVMTLDFPGYDRSMFGQIIGKYLTGEFGSPVEADPFESTLLFAGDRYHVRKQLIEAYNTGAIIVLNRYIPSNLAYSCAKLIMQNRSNEIDDFIRFNTRLEYDFLGLPTVDCAIFLDVDAATSNKLISQKGERQYLEGQERDQHESNRTLQDHVRDVYHKLAARDPNGWHVVQLTQNGQLRTVDKIHEDLKQALLAHL